MKVTFALNNGKVLAPSRLSASNLDKAKEQHQHQEVYDIARQAMDSFTREAGDFAKLDGRRDDMSLEKPTDPSTLQPPEEPGLISGLFPRARKEYAAKREVYEARVEDLRSQTQEWEAAAFDSAPQAGLVVTDSSENNRGASGHMRFSPTNFGSGHDEEGLSSLKGLEHLDIKVPNGSFQYLNNGTTELYTIKPSSGSHGVSLEFNNDTQTLTIDTEASINQGLFRPAEPQETYTFEMRDGQPIKPGRDDIENYTGLMRRKDEEKAFVTLGQELQIFNQEIDKFQAFDGKTDNKVDRAHQDGLVVSLSGDNELGISGELAFDPGLYAQPDEPGGLTAGLKQGRLEYPRGEIESHDTGMNAIEYKQEGGVETIQQSRSRLVRKKTSEESRRFINHNLTIIDRYTVDVESTIVANHDSNQVSLTRKSTRKMPYRSWRYHEYGQEQAGPETTKRPGAYRGSRAEYTPEHW